MIERVTESPIEADMLGALMAISGGGVVLPKSSHERVAEKARVDGGVVQRRWDWRHEGPPTIGYGP